MKIQNRITGVLAALPLALLTACNSSDEASTRPSDQSGMSSTRSFSTSEEARVLSILRAKDDEEVRIGRIAQRKATSAAARQYGDMLVNEHAAHRKDVTDARVARRDCPVGRRVGET